MRVGGKGFRSVLKISAGTAGAQAITVLAAPVISRIFSPSDFGTFTIIASISAVVAAVASLRWDFALMLPKSERDAHSLTTLGLLSAVLVCTVSLVVVAVAAVWVPAADELFPWLFVMPAVALVQAWLKVLNQLAIRHQRYSAIATRALMRSSAIVSAQIGLGLLGMRSGGLVVGLGLGNAVGILGLLRGAGFRSHEGRAGRRWSAVRRNAHTYRRYPLYLAPASLVNVLGTQLPVLLVGVYFGGTVAGLFGLTQSAIALPVALVGQAVAQVYLGEVSRAVRAKSDRQSALFRKASLALGLVGAGVALVLVTLAPTLFPIVFGPEWAMSGLFAALLAPGLALQLLVVPTSQTLSLLGRQRVQLWWDIGRAALCGGTFALLAELGAGPTACVLSVGVTTAVAYAVLWIVARGAVSNNVGSS